MHRKSHLIKSLVTRKPVFGVFKPACSATEISERLQILDIETRDIILSRQQTTKALIRLRQCAGRSAPLLFAYDKTGFLMTWLMKSSNGSKRKRKQITSYIIKVTVTEQQGSQLWFPPARGYHSPKTEYTDIRIN